VRRFASLRTYHAWLIAQGVRADDPTAGIRLHHPAAPARQPFAEDELTRIFGACRRDQERAIIRLLTDTGMRLSELAGMRLRDMDWGRGVLRVKGKGEKERLLALSVSTVAALRVSMDGRDYPWYSQRIHGPMTPDGIYRLMRRLTRRTGIHVYCHRFRTTFACRFLEETGGDVDALQVLLGHSKVSTTLGYARWGRVDRALAQQRRVALGDRL